MTKQDWIEVFGTLEEKSIFEYFSLGVSILSPILLLISIVISFQAAKASRESVELNEEIYTRQEKERRKSFQPIFKVEEASYSGHYIIFNLVNKNTNKFVMNHHGIERSVNDFHLNEEAENLFKITVYDDFHNKNKFKLWLFYTTLDHHSYQSEIILNVNESDILIKDHFITER